MSYLDDIAGHLGAFESHQDQQERFSNHQDFRNNTWVTKDGQQILVKDMSDRHLLNAYKKFGRSDLFKEMVVRLFEERV
jgi:hypothetical protein